MIDSLIDKLDTFEQVRDIVAYILAVESANQQVLATNAGKDADLWKLRVYIEAHNPWEAYKDPTVPGADLSPIVNVWWDNSIFDKKSSNEFERQTSETVINIDCYGYGVSQDVPGPGHTPGDTAAALAMQRAVRLVRNILMSDQYRYLGLKGLVGGRWPQAATSFQPTLEANTVQKIVGARIALATKFNEFAPQATYENIEYIAVDIKRASDGMLLAEADYDYTP